MDANTLTAVSIVVAAVPTWILAYRGLQQGDKIHTLVNSKMSSALAEIERLKKVVEGLQNGKPSR